MRVGRLIIFSIIFLIISYCVVKFDLVSYDYFVKTDFLFTFLGVFIGFALTLYTYITSMFGKMKDLIKEKYKGNQDQIDKRLAELPKLHTEIKDNIMYLFYVLIVVVLFSVGDKMLITLSTHWEEFKFIPKSILLTIFLLSIVSLKDLIVTSFTISDFIIKGNDE